MGGGLFIFFSVGDSVFAQERSSQRRFNQSLPDDFNAFLRIGEDGRVSCFTGKIEMGQGVITSLAQLKCPLGVGPSQASDIQVDSSQKKAFSCLRSPFSVLKLAS
jgi:CO/xanthine dehydrogenase Mo-binding subunit